MGRRIAVTLLAIVASLGYTVGTSLAAPGREVHPSGKVRYHAARGQAKPSRGGSPNLVFHGGQIMSSTTVQAIYWGTSWNSSSFVGDKITGLESFYSGVGGTSYANTTTEYHGSNGAVSGAVSYGGTIVDTTAAPSRAPSTSAILNEVARKISNPVSNGYYPVYVDTRRGSAGYCAWHSVGTINNVTVQFAFFFNLDGDSGCDPRDTWTSHTQGLAALANVTGHELSEAVTDPHLDAWYDNGGSENADKCAWTFHAPVNLSGTTWKVQGNWSNAAYNVRTGYTLGGCVDGT
jgi:hypothetical protein